MKKRFIDILWDLWCTFSIIGIWPRFIEPNLLRVKKKTVTFFDYPDSFKELKILHFSDLHLHPRVSNYFLEKLKKKIVEAKADMICFTGDFLCQAKLKDPERLKSFLSCLKAPLGVYAVFGNHDYNLYASIGSQGEYTVTKEPKSLIGKGFSILFEKKRTIQKLFSTSLKQVKPNLELLKLLKENKITLLENETIEKVVDNQTIQISGLGDYTSGVYQSDKTFSHIKKKGPWIVLSHNPDTIEDLVNYPADLFLFGHTHGGQVNLPFLWKKFTPIENFSFKYGLKKIARKFFYISCGVGSPIVFRWFAMPEIVLFTLKKDS